MTQQEALCDGEDSSCENETISQGHYNYYHLLWYRKDENTVPKFAFSLFWSQFDPKFKYINNFIYDTLCLQTNNEAIIIMKQNMNEKQSWKKRNINVILSSVFFLQAKELLNGLLFCFFFYLLGNVRIRYNHYLVRLKDTFCIRPLI